MFRKEKKKETLPGKQVTEMWKNTCCLLQLFSLPVLIKLQQTPWRGKPREWVQVYKSAEAPKADYSNEPQPLALFRQI